MTSRKTQEVAMLDVAQTESEGRQPMLLTHVDYEGGSSDIELLEGDDPREAAAAFCRRHDLADDVIEPLTAHLLSELVQQEFPDITQTETEAERQDLLHDEASGSYADISGSEADAGHDIDNWNPAASSQMSRPHSAAPSIQQQTSYGTQYDEPSEYTGHKTAASIATQEDGRLWGSSGLAGLRAGPRTRHITERLYTDAQKKEERLQEERRLRDEEAQKLRNQYKLAISARSHQLARNRTEASGYSNYGERMYVEGVLKQQERVQQVKEAEAAKEAEELAQIRADARPRRRSANAAVRGPNQWERLTQTRTEKTQERLRDLAREKEEAALAECSFAPAINRRSDRLMADRSSVLREHSITAYDQLFQDAGRRAARASEYEYYYPEEVTFRPAINRKRPPKRQSTFSATAAAPVSDRLYDHARRSADRLEAKRRKPPVDPKTGAPLFRPATGRAPLTDRNAPAIPVGERLFNKSREWEDKKVDIKAQKEQQIRKTMTTSHTDPASKAMMGKLKAKRFRQIFQYLEQRTGSEGSLDLVTMVFGEDQEIMDSLDEEVRADVEAAATFLSRRIASNSNSPSSDVRGAHTTPRQQNGSNVGVDHRDDSTTGEVDLLQFAALMEEVLKKHRHVRAYLLPSSAPRKKWEEPTFKPATNARSLAMAARRRPPEERGCDILHNIAAENNSRRRSRQDAALAAEMQKCTFKPEVLSTAPRRRPASSASATSHALVAHSTPGSSFGGGGSSGGSSAGDDVTSAADGATSAYASSVRPPVPESVATERTTQTIRRPSNLSSRRPTPAKGASRNSDYNDLASLNARVMAAMAETAELLPDLAAWPIAS